MGGSLWEGLYTLSTISNLFIVAVHYTHINTCHVTVAGVHVHHVIDYKINRSYPYVDCTHVRSAQLPLDKLS